MKNREMLEYLKLCGDREIDLDSRLNDIFLDSEVIIKDFYVKFKDLNCTDAYIGGVLQGLFRKFKSDEERAEAMEKICMVTDLYKKHLGHINFLDYKRNLKYELMVHDTHDIDTMIDRLRVLKFGIMILLNGKRYLIYRLRNEDGSEYISLSDSRDRIEKVGAILFKDGEYETYHLRNKRDSENILRIILNNDYDLCVCIDRESVMKNKN